MEELLHSMSETKDAIIGHKQAVKKRQVESDEARNRTGNEIITASSKRRTIEEDKET